MNFKVTSICIVRGPYGPDHIYLRTNLPNACWPHTSEQTLQFDCSANQGEEYVKKHFPDVPVEMVVHKYSY